MVGWDLNKACPPWSPGLVSHKGHGGRVLRAPLTDIRSSLSARRTGSNQPEVRGGEAEGPVRGFLAMVRAGGWKGTRHSHCPGQGAHHWDSNGKPAGACGGQAEWRAGVLGEDGPSGARISSPEVAAATAPAGVRERLSPTLLANCQLPREARGSPVPHSASADRASEGDRGPQVGPPPKLFSSTSRLAAILVDFNGRATWVRSAFFLRRALGWQCGGGTRGQIKAGNQSRVWKIQACWEIWEGKWPGCENALTGLRGRRVWMLGSEWCEDSRVFF